MIDAEKYVDLNKEKYVKEIENLMNDKDYYNNKSEKGFQRNN